MTEPDTTADAIRELFDEHRDDISWESLRDNFVYLAEQLEANRNQRKQVISSWMHHTRELAAERDALQQRVDREERLLPDDWWPGDSDDETEEIEDDIGVIPPIRTDEMVMVTRAIYERQVEELEKCKQRVERLRAYSEELVWGVTATEQKALEHLHAGDLGDETGDG